jgi:hypothetical protein
MNAEDALWEDADLFPNNLDKNLKNILIPRSVTYVVYLERYLTMSLSLVRAAL